MDQSTKPCAADSGKSGCPSQTGRSGHMSDWQVYISVGLDIVALYFIRLLPQNNNVVSDMQSNLPPASLSLSQLQLTRLGLIVAGM